MRLLAVIFIYTLIFSACAPAPEITETQISLGAAASDFPGGLYVVGHKMDSREAFVHRMIEGQTFKKELPNGKWEFALWGWKGSSPMEGELKCEMLPPMKLNGEDLKIDAKLTSLKCTTARSRADDDNLFGRPEFMDGNQPKPIEFKSCAYLSPENVNQCPEGKHQYFKLGFYEVDLVSTDNMFKGLKNPVFSRCYNASSNEINFPIFTAGFPFIVKSYIDSSCSQSEQASLFKYGGENKNVALFKNAIEASATKTIIKVNSNICSGAYDGRRLGQIYYICNYEQFENIASDLDGHYHVRNSLDLSSFATIPGVFAGYLSGHNLRLKGLKVPLFERVARNSGINNLYLDSPSLSISSTPDRKDVGFIAMTMDDSNQGGELRNIILVNPKVENRSSHNQSSSGLLFGRLNLNQAMNSTAPISPYRISNITVKGSDTFVKGKNFVGGLIGRVLSNQEDNPEHLMIQDVEISDLFLQGQSVIGGLVGEGHRFNVLNTKLYNLKLKGDVEYLGGFVGNVTAPGGHANFINSYVISEITCTSSDCNYVGGVAGYFSVNTPSLIYGLHSKLTYNSDILKAVSTRVGGIAGEVQLSTSSPTLGLIIDNSYSNLISQHQSNNSNENVSGNTHFGGAIGYLGCSQGRYSHRQSLIYSDFGETKALQRGGVTGKAYTSAQSPSSCQSTFNQNITRINALTAVVDADNDSNDIFIGNNNFVNSSQNHFIVPNSLDQSNFDDQIAGIDAQLNYSIYGNDNSDIFTSQDTPILWLNNRLIFELNLGFMSNGNLDSVPQYRIGNIHRPLYIESVTDWNFAATKPNLMSKSFKLKSHLNFGNEPDSFIPFGGKQIDRDSNLVPFTGHFDPNGQSISNVAIELSGDYLGASGEVNDWHPDLLAKIGIFRKIGSTVAGGLPTIIGTSSSPLKVYGMSIKLSDNVVSSVGALAGVIENAQVSARIYKLSIEGGALGSQEIGGLAGIAQNGVRIIDSGIEGIYLNSPNAYNVGGLIGQTQNFVEIESSKVGISMVSGKSSVGGLIGEADTDELSARYSYVHVFPSGKIRSLDADNAHGFIGYTEGSWTPSQPNRVDYNFVNAINGSIESKGAALEYTASSSNGFAQAQASNNIYANNLVFSKQYSGSLVVSSFQDILDDHPNFLKNLMGLSIYPIESGKVEARLFWE